ncbi:MAG: hypothetical protein ACOX6T_19940 [Myxococcales bacterium]|jgi:hypothetical protein
MRPVLLSSLALSILILAFACEPDPPPCVPACGEKVCGDDECGGSCGECGSEYDCIAGACVWRPTCLDELQNGTESDVDCGGSDCEPCEVGRRCRAGSDCQSGRCEQSVCLSCEDGVRNGDESDIDCGGGCAACADGKLCGSPGDCASGRCAGGLCVSCSDGITNGLETDLDCGGDCEPCRQGSACQVHADCVSRTCIGLVCEDPTCTDAVLNANETDVDCGGAECPKCTIGKSCRVHDDCAPGACWDGLCAVPECQKQRDCGDIVQEIVTELCLDKRCEPASEIDPSTGKPRQTALTVELRFAGAFVTSPTKPRSAVLRFVDPRKLDGSRVTCAQLATLHGATQATCNALDYDAGLNLIYRNLFTLDWQSQAGTNVFDLPITLPSADEAILWGEVWYGSVAGELNPTGNLAAFDCIEGIDLGALGSTPRLTLTFSR